MTGEPSSRGSAPAGNAVTNDPSPTPPARTGSPRSSTSGVPSLQGDSPADASDGPSEASGVTTAAVSATPAAPPAAAIRPRRETPCAPAVNVRRSSRRSSSVPRCGRGSMAVSCGTTRFPAVTSAAAARMRAVPRHAPRIGVLDVST